MLKPTTTANRLQMSFYREERPMYKLMEERLRKVYGIPTTSGIYKLALKKLDSITKIAPQVVH